MFAADVHQPGHQARNAPGVVRASDSDHRNAAVRFGRKQVVHDGFAHWLAWAVGRFDVREQPGAGVDLNDGGALAVQGQGAVLQHHVHPRNVQAHHAGGQGGGGGHAGVYQRGHVQRHVAVALNQHALVFGRHGLGCHAKAFKLQNDFRTFARGHHIEREVLAPATPWVAVDLQFGQLVDGV